MVKKINQLHPFYLSFDIWTSLDPTQFFIFFLFFFLIIAWLPDSWTYCWETSPTPAGLYVVRVIILQQRKKSITWIFFFFFFKKIKKETSQCRFDSNLVKFSFRKRFNINSDVSPVLLLKCLNRHSLRFQPSRFFPPPPPSSFAASVRPGSPLSGESYRG